MRKANKSAEPTQSARFIEAAQRIGTDETGAQFERAMKKIVKVPKGKVPAR